MYRSTLLAPSHYAGRWAIPNEDQRNDLKVVNALGHAYAVSVDGPEKETQLLVLLEYFHGYLMKYVCMVIRGTSPPVNSHAGRDAIEFLRQMAPKAAKQNPEVVGDTCKMLHLAFKEMTTEDIYDTMMFCFVKAARRYDPHYANKVKTVCEEISGLSKGKFTREQLELGVGFRCTGFLGCLYVRAIWPQLLARRPLSDKAGCVLAGTGVLLQVRPYRVCLHPSEMVPVLPERVCDWKGNDSRRAASASTPIGAHCFQWPQS